MPFDCFFRFVDDELQRELIETAARVGITHFVDTNGYLYYPSASVSVIENEFLCPIRNRLFPEWRVFTLEGDDVSRPRVTEAYRRYMVDHEIRHYEEHHNGETWFLVSSANDSFDWEVGAEPGRRFES